MSHPPSDDAILAAVADYRTELQNVATIYRNAGRHLAGRSDRAEASVGLNDLANGLIMKVFASVVPQVSAESIGARQLGRVTLQHIWGSAVQGDRLREAIGWLIQTANEFEWRDLLRPLASGPEGQSHIDAVRGSAVRMAQLITAVDGDDTDSDQRAIDAMLRRMTIQGAESIMTEPGLESNNDPLAWLRGEAARLRDQTSSLETQPAVRETQSAGSSGNWDSTVLQPAPESEQTAEERLEAARAKLDRLVGLDAIKDQIQTLSNFLKMQSLREAEGLPVTRGSLHMAFVGNPGTGKTTVARIVADIFGALGVLTEGHLIETDRSGLVAEFAGQTGPKTNKVIDEALDGVLFIDEAYTLTDPDGRDQYGREAIQTLLKRMEDQRDRLVVILAGYPNEMAAMIRSNPGLSSRVGTTLHFDDYPPMALCQIFELIASSARYELPGETRRRLLRGMTALHAARDRHFGNGRLSRNTFERTVRRMANRLVGTGATDRTSLVTIRPSDVEFPELPDNVLDVLCKNPGVIRAVCPHCTEASIIADEQLGATDDCPKCKQSRAIPWGEPVPCITDLVEIMRGDGCRHPHGDAAGTIDQKVWNLRGQHCRLGASFIISWNEVDGVEFEVF